MIRYTVDQEPFPPSRTKTSMRMRMRMGIRMKMKMGRRMGIRVGMGIKMRMLWEEQFSRSTLKKFNEKNV